MTEEQVREIADNADEWSVPCRNCGAERFVACVRDFNDDSTDAHRVRITDAAIEAVRQAEAAEVKRAAGEAGPGAA